MLPADAQVLQMHVAGWETPKHHRLSRFHAANVVLPESYTLPLYGQDDGRIW